MTGETTRLRFEGGIFYAERRTWFKKWIPHDEAVVCGKNHEVRLKPEGSRFTMLQGGVEKTVTAQELNTGPIISGGYRLLNVEGVVTLE